MEQLSKYTQVIRKLNLIILVLIAFSLPFYRLFSLYLSVLWILIFLLEGRYRQRFAGRKPERGILILFLLFYFIHLTGLFYSQNKDAAWIDIILKLPFLFMPLFFFISGEQLRGERNKILSSFIAGNFIASVICLLAATFRSLTFFNGHWFFDAELMEHNYSFWKMLANGGNNFMYEALSMFIHPGYFSILAVASVVIVVDMMYHKDAGKSRLSKFLLILLIVFFCIMVYLLFSRTGLIALFLSLFAYSLYAILKAGSTVTRVAMLLLVAVITLGGFFVMSHNGRMKNSYYEIKRFFSDPSSISKNDDRLFIWGLSLDIIKEHPIIGVGTGDSKDELMKKYREKGMADALKARLNVHNQFLETTTQLGLVGLLSLLSLLVFPFIKAFRSKDVKLALIIIVNTLFLFFESALNTQAGVYYFVFMLSVLIMIPKGEKGEKSLPTQVGFSKP